METTVSTLKWGILYMLREPHIQVFVCQLYQHNRLQKRLRDEIRDAIGDRVVTMADRNRLPYVNAAIIELQRCGNIVPVNVFHQTTQVC